jgi:phosphotransferase system enzyme I (PtsI)
MDLPRELNPFLGYRAIRLCLDRPLMFKTQLRAILRAAVHGDVKVMFPMIVTLEELLRAKALLAEAGDELAARGAEFRRDIPVGIMIETPAAAMISDQLAKYADFFSIGTNDLIQYTTASDRMNQQVQYLYDWCNIAVLRLIRLVCENGEKQGIEVGICGETASEPALIPLWIGMGVAELSVAPALLGRTKYIARNSLAGLARARLPEILALGEIGAAREALAQLGRDTEAALKGRRGAD